MENERFENYYNLPKIILEIMEWLCDTKFYKETYKERKEFYEDIQEKWKFCDFEVLKGRLDKPLIICIGEIPKYKGDYEKMLYIDFDDIDSCCLCRGQAIELYASKVIRKRYPIPKYMKSKLNSFIERYKQEVL